MSFIEVSEGTALNTDFIEKVVSTTSGCDVHCGGIVHPSSFPYRLFLQLIGSEEKEEVQEVRLEPKAQNALDSLGHHFAG